MFPKDFLRPYGIATERINSTAFKKRLQTFTCELLRRPGVGVSEFSQTIEDNMERLNLSLSKIMSNDNIQSYLNVLNCINDVSRHLNMKGQINKSDIEVNVKKLFKKICNTNKTNKKIIDSFMHIGASLYLIGLHVKVFDFTINHSSWVKKKVKGGNVFNKLFKKWAEKKCSEERSMKGYMELVKNELKESVKGKFKVDLEGSSESESDRDSESERDEKKSSKRRKVVSSESDESGGSESEEVKRTDKSRKGRKGKDESEEEKRMKKGRKKRQSGSSSEESPKKKGKVLPLFSSEEDGDEGAKEEEKGKEVKKEVMSVDVGTMEERKAKKKKSKKKKEIEEVLFL